MSAAIAQSLPATSVVPVPAPPAEETLLVIGEQPGPGMWKVSKGDHVMWIIGTQTPVLEKMKWRAKGIKAVIAEAQEILSEPRISISTGQIGFFRALMLLPSAMEARKNPDNAMLKDIIPAELYPRWLVLRDRYVEEFNTTDESKDIERWLPMFAAYELYGKAIKKSGMTLGSPVWPVITAVAKTHKVNIRNIVFEPTIRDPGAALKELRSTRLADLECFAKTIERIETDLSAMRQRANAWASGDIDALRRLPASDQRAACSAAIRDASFVKTLGVQNVTAQVENAWMIAAESALANNKVTLAVLPVADLFAADGYLTKLRKRGYSIAEPDATP
ncbi:MAG: TraB/GumN family protein [Pseudomonadota bacterium]